MFKLAVFVTVIAAVFAAEEPRFARQGFIQPIQPLVASINPAAYYKHDYPYQHQVYAKGTEAAARIVSHQHDAAPDGSGYAYSFETENGIAVQEQGQYRAISPEEGIQAVVGSYRYTLPDGRVQIVEYQADENGYRPIVKYQ